VTSLLWLVFGGTTYWLLTRKPADFQVKVIHPEEVRTGEEFDLAVEIFAGPQFFRMNDLHLEIRGFSSEGHSS